MNDNANTRSSDFQNGVRATFGAFDCCCLSRPPQVVTDHFLDFLKRSWAFTVYGVLLNHIPLIMWPTVRDPLKVKGKTTKVSDGRKLPCANFPEQVS